MKLIHESLITESLLNDMFRICLDNENQSNSRLCFGEDPTRVYPVLPGDRVKIEVSYYDSTSRGCIIYRLRNEDSND